MIFPGSPHAAEAGTLPADLQEPLRFPLAFFGQGRSTYLILSML